MKPIELEKLLIFGDEDKKITVEQVRDIFKGESEAYFSIEDMSCCDIHAFQNNDYLVFVIDMVGTGIEIETYQIDSYNRMFYKLVECGNFSIMVNLYKSLISRGMFPYP